MKRSNEQKRAFALNCQEIEKEGGDVLGFIEVNWLSYTPRATWYNLQRQYLNRQTHQLTEGKYITPEERRLNELRADKGKQLDEVLKVLEEGKDPIEYLEEIGYRAPAQAWADLKIWARKHRPEDREKLPSQLNKYYAEHGIQRPVKAGAGPKKVERPAEVRKAVETVFFGGKEYEKLEGEGAPVNEYREKPSPTCCQPARPSGVTVPEKLPEEKTESLPVCAVKSRVKGEWHLSPIKGCVHLIWEDKIMHEERSLGLPAEDWKKLSEEIPVMLKQLGL